MTTALEPDGRVVIAGTGVAGATAAQTLRADGFTGPIVLVGNENDEPYRRPTLSKDVLSGRTDIERARLKPATFWADKGIDLRTGTTITSVDPNTRALSLCDGTTLRYDALLLATGGRARRLPGTRSSRVHYLRHHADVPALRESLSPGSSLLVIGGGLIGSEVASTARGLGCDVTVLEAQDRPLSRLLPEPVGAAVAGLHRGAGIDLHTGVDLTDVQANEHGVSVTASDGRTWQADTAVVAIGMIPNTELADRTDIEVDNGILVDELLRTSVDRVFAAGDVANTPNLVLGGRCRGEHWNVAQEHGVAAAKSILGTGMPYDAVPWSWSNQFDRNIQVAGWPAADDELLVRGSIDDYDFTAICRRSGRIVGGVTIGRPKDTRALRALIRYRADVPIQTLIATDTDLSDLAATPIG